MVQSLEDFKKKKKKIKHFSLGEKKKIEEKKKPLQANQAYKC